MHFRASRILGLAALAAGLSLTAAHASAQQAIFHLPFAAHWGPMILESGDYRVSDPAGQTGSHLIYISQHGHDHMVLAQSSVMQPGPIDRGSLELVNVNGAYFVKRYKSAVTGQIFTFPVPKAAPETEMASAAVKVVPIASAK